MAEPLPFTERELRLRMDGLQSFDEERAAAVELAIGDVVARVLPLPRIVASKRAAARPKDRLVVPVLEEIVALLPAARDLEKP